MNEVMIFFAGLLALIVGAELIVRGASRLAALLGINPLLIGLTIVSIGTSMPELAVGITAGLQGSGPLAVANIAGTNLYVAMLIAGMAITVIGADWLVDGATGVARMIDIPEAIIGLSIVAIGTSAPELFTTIVATLRDERDVAIGNLLGSSIYNILLVLGLASMAAPTGLAVTRQLQLFDIPLMTLVALACVPVFLTGRRISRLEGGLGVAAYLIYLIWLVLFRA